MFVTKTQRLTLSKYFGMTSAMNFALAGATSLGLMITQLPAAMAPVSHQFRTEIELMNMIR